MKMENAYMTVEAALIFPITMASILFVIYFMLFQYNRCLMEQDLGAMALWGSLEEAGDTAMIQNAVQRRMSEMYRDKYAVWEFTGLNASLKKNRFSAKGSGQRAFPFPGLNFWGSGSIWTAQAEYEYSRLAPVTFIRMCRKAHKAMEK